MKNIMTLIGLFIITIVAFPDTPENTPTVYKTKCEVSKRIK